MTKLRFSFKDTIDEVAALSSVSGSFVAPECRHVLDQLKQALEGLQTSRQTTGMTWGIPEHSPLRTIASVGAYHPGGGGTHRVCAQITSKWEIRRIPAAKRSMPAAQFELDGAASTRVRIVKLDDQDQKVSELAMWRMEIGNNSSPGCHFHVQVLGEQNDGPFPHSLDIPRLPSVFATPPSVLEYVLGEVFQDQWLQAIAAGSAELSRWNAIQRKRLSALLSWKLGLVSGATGAPWPALKRAKPGVDLFAPVAP